MKGILEGKNATCYPGFEGKLKGAYPKDSNVVEDQNIITSEAWVQPLIFPYPW